MQRDKYLLVLFVISSLERSSMIEAIKEDGSKIFGDSSRIPLVMCSGKPTKLDLLSLRKIIFQFFMGFCLLEMICLDWLQPAWSLDSHLVSSD